MRLVLWCVLFVEILDRLCSSLVGVGQGVWKVKKTGGRLLMHLYQHGIMALMIVYEVLGLLIARDTY